MNRLIIRNSIHLTKHFNRNSNTNLVSSLSTIITISSVRMKSYLINEEKYAFLKELGLSEVNPGVFSKHGRWFGDGEVLQHNST